MDVTPFSDDYQAARARFRAAADSAGLERSEHPIGIGGLDLSVDAAYAGPERASRLLLVTSGLHGVEGFLGSAVQLTLLEGLLRRGLPAGVRVALVHALNPFGFREIRRFDDRNIDPNRNFLPCGEPYAGAPARYRDFDGLLNPRRPPSRFDPFPLRALLAAVRHGSQAIKQAVVGGQYEYPLGLFFGGEGPSRTRRVVEENLPRWAGGAERVVHLDFHSGLGRWAEYKLLLVGAMEDRRGVLAEAFDPGLIEAGESGDLDSARPRKRTAYEARGDFLTWCRKEAFRDRSYDGICAEVGTYPGIEVMAALRAENQAHHWGVAGSPATLRAKARLREVFIPADPAWRASVVARGVGLVERGIEFVSRD